MQQQLQQKSGQRSAVSYQQKIEIQRKAAKTQRAQKSHWLLVVGCQARTA